MPFDADYFNQVYRQSEDPWGLHTLFYEARKRAILLASLPQRRYRRAFEPACATGALTTELAQRCDALLASDMNASAVHRTRKLVGHLPQVTVQELTVPGEWPEQQFDLIVISEFLYYLSADQVEQLCARIRSGLMSEGTVVACHWKRTIDASIPCGDRLHAFVDTRLGLHRMVHHDEPDFVLDVWSTQDRSVAQCEGLAP
ncbi:methyltransferase domain-containing protein [Parapusillimonas sp. SGNA-6]|nr:methyltransferase domain-containing protein [Parapusillimonas sp. SGNA-6]